jgi:DNA-binding response OmpR family regulator
MNSRKPCILVTGGATPLHRRIRLALRAEGYDVLKASSYSRAVAMTHGYRPDLVLLDMDLPGTMDGFDFCTMIRQSLQTPIIAISVQPDLQRKVRALDLGADDYLAEPWSMDELLARLRACLRRATSHHGPPRVEYGFIQHVHKGGVASQLPQGGIAEREQLHKNDETSRNAFKSKVGANPTGDVGSKRNQSSLRCRVRIYPARTWDPAWGQVIMHCKIGERI